MELIHHTGVAKDETIIDVGGGASLLVDFLCNESFTNLSVLDISAKALASARARLTDLANNIEWFEADITEFNPPHQYTVWHDRAVFHFLTEKSGRSKYVNVLTRAL